MGLSMGRTKVMVEFYSEEPLENVMAMIKYQPEKIIFLGHKDNMITKRINDIINGNQTDSKTEYVLNRFTSLYNCL